MACHVPPTWRVCDLPLLVRDGHVMHVQLEMSVQSGGGTIAGTITQCKHVVGILLNIWLQEQFSVVLHILHLWLILSMCMGGPISIATTVPPLEATARGRAVSPTWRVGGFLGTIVIKQITTVFTNQLEEMLTIEDEVQKLDILQSGDWSQVRQALKGELLFSSVEQVTLIHVRWLRLSSKMHHILAQ